MDESKLQDIANWSRNVPNPRIRSVAARNQIFHDSASRAPHDVTPPVRAGQGIGPSSPRQLLPQSLDRAKDLSRMTTEEEEREMWDREERLYQRKMARRESKALRTCSPPPVTPVEAKPLPLRRGRNNVIRRAEEPEITEPRNKRRRTRVEEWERFDSRTAPNGKRLTLPQGVRGRKGLFERSLTSKLPEMQALRSRRPSEAEEEGDWRDAWRALKGRKVEGSPRVRTPQERAQSPLTLASVKRRYTYQLDDATRRVTRPGDDQLRSANSISPRAGRYASTPIIPPSSSQIRPFPEAVREPYYSPSWPTFSTNPTTSPAVPRPVIRVSTATASSSRAVTNQDQERGRSTLGPSLPSDNPPHTRPNSSIRELTQAAHLRAHENTQTLNHHGPNQYRPHHPVVMWAADAQRHSVPPIPFQQSFDRHAFPHLHPPIYVSQSSRRTSLLTPEQDASQVGRTLQHGSVPYSPIARLPTNGARGLLRPSLEHDVARHLLSGAYMTHRTHTAPSRSFDPRDRSEEPDLQALRDTTLEFNFAQPPMTALNLDAAPLQSPYLSDIRQGLSRYVGGLASPQDAFRTPMPKRGDLFPEFNTQASPRQFVRPTGVEDALAQLAELIPSSSHRSRASGRSQSEPRRPVAGPVPIGETRTGDKLPLIQSYSYSPEQPIPQQYAYAPQTPPQQVSSRHQDYRSSYDPPTVLSPVSPAPRVPLVAYEPEAVENAVPIAAATHSQSSPRLSTSTYARSRHARIPDFYPSSTSDPLLLQSDELAEEEVRQYGTTKHDWGKLWSDARNEL